METFYQAQAIPAVDTEILAIQSILTYVSQRPVRVHSQGYDEIAPFKTIESEHAATVR